MENKKTNPLGQPTRISREAGETAKNTVAQAERKGFLRRHMFGSTGDRVGAAPRQNNIAASLNNEKPRQNSGPVITPPAAPAPVISSQAQAAPANFFGKPGKSLKVIFLGGVGEIGKNMTAIECDNEIVIIDAGSSFPNDDLPGIDLVIQDLSYLINNKNKVKAIVLTHGHEDHIGGIPYLLKDINVPIYGSSFTLGLIAKKLDEFPAIKYNAFVIKPRQQVKVGNNFYVEFIKVSHSIAGSQALAIKTPAGIVVHTGDFKIDWTPIDNEPTDLPRFAELGRLGVLLLLCESTNVCRPGYTMSERTVGVELDRLFTKYKEKRLLIATFASNTGRLQQIFDLAEKHGRKIVFTGRSMVNVSEIGMKLGELRVNRQNIIDVDKMANFPDKELCVVTTGSQGEPMSALSRIASGDFQKLKAGENDVIIMSSSPIPGNEKSVNNVINALYRRGATVLDDDVYDVHVSGHACEEEIKAIHKLTRPRFFIPIHGEYRHLRKHYELALSLGMSRHNVLTADIGDVIEVNSTYMKHAGTVPSGERLVDGLGVGDSESVVLRDRRQLAEEGLCVAILGIDASSGEITTGPDLITRGLVYDKEIADLVNGAKEMVANALKVLDKKNIDQSEIKNIVRKTLQNFFDKKIHRRPMVLTVILPGLK